MQILITEPKDYSKKALAMYASLGNVTLMPELSAEELARLESTVECIVIRLAHKIDGSWFDRMPNLKIIATPTTGLNHIDMDGAAKRGIAVISLKGHTSFLKDIPSTAEETFALMLALVRNIPWAFEDVKAGHWNRDAWKGHQFIHKTLGLVGVGRLGKIVAKYAQAFGMQVIGYDPKVDEAGMAEFGVKKVGMDELFRESDIVSVHVALEPDTHNLIGTKQFELMKEGSYLVNTARGEIIDEAAMLEALASKRLAGAALDVLWNEASDGSFLAKNPLCEYAKANKNLLIVPHVGGATYEAMQVTEDFIANLVREHIGQ